MSRIALVLLATVLVVAAPADGHTSVTRLQVVAREFSFTLSRTKVHAGNAIIELANFGQDPHDLRADRIGHTGSSAAIDPVAGGQQGELFIKLKPGRYHLYCSLADHESRGMSAELVVKSP
jgi:plastocyanin